MYGCESWTLKKAERWRTDCFKYVLLDKTLESPLDSKEIKPVNPKGNQCWMFIGRTGAEAEAPILWPAKLKNWHIGKDWCWERLRAGGEGDDKGGDGWMASLTQWMSVWANSWRWWGIGKPGLLQSMWSQSQTRLRDWTESTFCLWFCLLWTFHISGITQYVIIHK